MSNETPYQFEHHNDLSRLGGRVDYHHKYHELLKELKTLSRHCAVNTTNPKLKEKLSMANDPLSIIAAVSAFITEEVADLQADVAQIATLTAQLAAAVAATDTVSPDVQAALDALQTQVTAAQGASSAVSAAAPAVTTPPAGS